MYAFYTHIYIYAYISYIYIELKLFQYISVLWNVFHTISKVEVGFGQASDVKIQEYRGHRLPGTVEGCAQFMYESI